MEGRIPQYRDRVRQETELAECQRQLADVAADDLAALRTSPVNPAPPRHLDL